MPSRRFELTFPEALWERIEDLRGHEPRASFIKRTLESALGSPSNPAPAQSRMSERDWSMPPRDIDGFKHEPEPFKRPAAPRIVGVQRASEACPECGRFNGVHAKSCSLRNV